MTQDISKLAPAQQDGATSDAADPTMTKDAVSAWVVDYIEGKGISPIPVDELTPIEDYGLDSLAAVELSGQLGDFLGREIDAMLMYQYATIKELSGALASEVGDHQSAQPAVHMSGA